MDDGLGEFSDFKTATESNISDMAEAFAKRTNANGKIIFGHGRMKGLKGLMHWIQDQYRCNNQIVHVNFTLKEMHLALEQAHSCKQEREQMETVSKAATPAKFSKEWQWPSFYQAFKNYLSTFLGVFGVPLLYVICEIDPPVPGETYPMFVDQAVA